MMSLNTIKVGQRFSMCATDFEICDVSSGIVRYAEVIGGKMNHIPIKKFINLLDNKIINDLEKTKDITPDQLNKAEADEMKRRLTYLREVIAKTNNHVSRKEVPPALKRIADELKDKKQPSFATYARWYKTYISSDKNPLSLVPMDRNKGNRCYKFDPAIELIISKHIFTDWLNAVKPTISVVYANITGEIVEQYSTNNTLPYDTRFPTLKVITNRIHALDPFKKDKFRNGKHYANRKFRAAGSGIFPTRILEIVQADGNYLDVLLIDEITGEVNGRAYLTMIIDVFSRCIIAYTISYIPFSSATLLATLKKAVAGAQTGHGGIFESIYVDNGSDYLSTSVKNFCNCIGGNMEHGSPFDPNTKAHIERTYRTINTQVIHLIPGTTFSNTIEKGDYNSEKYACMTISDLNELLSDWIKNIYHKSIHSGTGRAPELLWADSKKDNPIHTYHEKDLDKIAREVVIKKISKGRIRHMYIYWYSHALATVEEKLRQRGIKPEVEVYIDTLNLSKIYVKNPDKQGEFITCNSTNFEYTNNLSMYEHKLVIADQKEKTKKDISSYPNKYLEIAKYELWKKIVKKGTKFARKQIARIKDSENYATHSISDLQKNVTGTNNKITNARQGHPFEEGILYSEKDDINNMTSTEASRECDENTALFGYERI